MTFAKPLLPLVMDACPPPGPTITDYLPDGCVVFEWRNVRFRIDKTLEVLENRQDAWLHTSFAMLFEHVFRKEAQNVQPR